MGKAVKARDINSTIRYTVWSVFRLRDVLGDDADRGAEASELTDLFDKLVADDVVTRGVYDVSAFRADADVMLWWHAENPDQLQDAYNRFR
ncbi:MAG: chlorite dismutase family protein, partial [Nocardioides sp.]